jgi:xanthine dehydrogenase small subunit
MNDSVPATADEGDLCTKPIHFWRAGRIHKISHLSPNQTLLDYLRSAEGLHARGTKEGCAEGDCGACTVVIAELEEASKPLRFRAINSCIRFAHQIDGCALWTVEDLSAAPGEGALHPVQQALLEAHGSQCGFCTPGFVMSLFALYQGSATQAIDRQDAITALSGNLCRCTGYRPILDAAQAMMHLPRVEQPEDNIKTALLQLAHNRSLSLETSSQRVFRPANLKTLLHLRQAYPQAQLIAGATDVGLWVTKQGQRFEQVVDISATKDLKSIIYSDGLLEIGAAVRLEDAYRAIVHSRPQVTMFARRFAGLPVRQSGTLGGNLANGSPIGDSMPLLISLGTKIRLVSQARSWREMALEDFYLTYRRTQLANDEVLSHILIPLPRDGELSRIYKVSKRFEDDISALCLGIHVRLDSTGEMIESARIGVGGMAATPTRAYRTETTLIGRGFTLETFLAAKVSISTEFAPIDDMRASALYRGQVAGNLMLRFWHEIHSPNALNSLESFEATPISLHKTKTPSGSESIRQAGSTEPKDRP